MLTKNQIKSAEKMLLDKYDVGARIVFNIQGFDVITDRRTGAKEQESMTKDIQKIIGNFPNTDYCSIGR